MLENMVMDICGADIFSSIFETLSINLFSSSDKFAPVLTIIRTIQNSITTVSVMMMFIYFLVALVDKCSSENFSWEQLWRQLAMLLATKYLMEHGFELMETLFNIGMAVTADVNNASGIDIAQTSMDAAALVEAFKQSLNLPKICQIPYLDNIIVFCQLLLPWAGAWIMRLAVSIICYSRVIEIYMRAAMAPIALSDFFHSGLQGSGWRSLKSFFAVSLQGAVILIIAIIYSKLFESLTLDESAGLFSYLGTFLVIYASSVMLMFKSLSLTKELVGVA